MTERTTTATEATPRPRCLMGRATGHGCPFPVEPAPRWSPHEPPRLCAFHAATEPLVEEENQVGIALELLEEWARRADELDNRPLQHLIGGARQEFGERLALIEGVLEDLRSAEMRLFRPRS